MQNWTSSFENTEKWPFIFAFKFVFPLQWEIMFENRKHNYLRNLISFLFENIFHLYLSTTNENQKHQKGKTEGDRSINHHRTSRQIPNPNKPQQTPITPNNQSTLPRKSPPTPIHQNTGTVISRALLTRGGENSIRPQ